MELENIKLDDILRFKNEMEVNILARKIESTKVSNDIALEVATELLLKSLLYYVAATKPKELTTLNEVLREIEASKLKKDENCYINYIYNLPKDHPAVLYRKELNSLDEYDMDYCFDEIKVRINLFNS